MTRDSRLRSPLRTCPRGQVSSSHREGHGRRIDLVCHPPHGRHARQPRKLAQIRASQSPGGCVLCRRDDGAATLHVLCNDDGAGRCMYYVMGLLSFQLRRARTGRTWMLMTFCAEVSEPLKSDPPSSRALIANVALPACPGARRKWSRPAAEMDGSNSKRPGGDEAVLTINVMLTNILKVKSSRNS